MPLPSTGITQLLRYYWPLRHPSAPGLSLAGVRLIIPDHALGLPVLRALSLCTCCRHYPGAAAGRIPRSSHPAVSAFPGRGRRVGLHIDLFEACSAFTRVAACTLARSPFHDPLSEGFRHFVASMPAPVASGWSESPGGPRTHWKAPPCHGAPRNTAFTYKGKAVDAKQIGRDLGVRYVVEGSVRRGGDQVLVNVQLIDTESGAHVWAERFE